MSGTYATMSGINVTAAGHNVRQRFHVAKMGDYTMSVKDLGVR